MTADEIKDLCAWIESNQDATLADLAQRTGLSPSHLQRTFKAAVGISPRQYLENLRVNNFKSQLRDNPQREVTAAIYDAGFSSSSRVYEKPKLTSA